MNVKLSTVMITIVLMGLISAILFSITDPFVESYGVEVNETLREAFNQSSQIAEEAEQLQESIKNIKLDPTNFLSGVVDIAIFIKDIFTLPLVALQQIIANILAILPIPAYIAGFLGTILTLVLIFIVFALILRYKDT